jgi:hypothetical protein
VVEPSPTKALDAAIAAGDAVEGEAERIQGSYKKASLCWGLE